MGLFTSRLNRFKQDPDCVFAEDLGNIQRMRDKYTVTGNPQQVNSPFGKAMYFGGSDWISCGTQPQWNFTGEITLLSYIKINTVPVQTRVISHAIAADPRYQLILNTNGTVLFYIDDGVIADPSITSAATIDDNEWHLVAGVHDGTNRIVYVDTTSLSEAAALNNFTPNGNLEIASYSSGTNPMTGIIAFCLMFKRGLTEAEIADIVAFEAF